LALHSSSISSPTRAKSATTSINQHPGPPLHLVLWAPRRPISLHPHQRRCARALHPRPSVLDFSACGISAPEKLPGPHQCERPLRLSRCQ
jgi:hypothetical protein